MISSTGQLDEHDEALRRLDRDLKRFRIDFERYFSGNLPVPPEMLRINIGNQIKELRTANLKGVALRFRFNTLEAHFNTILVFFNRRLREQERGQGRRRPAVIPDEPAFDPRKGVVIDSDPAAGAVQALYDELYGGAGRAAKTDFDRFQSYLLTQAGKIRDKTGCQQVQFRIADEGGKLKLKAKAQKKEGG